MKTKDAIYAIKILTLLGAESVFEDSEQAFEYLMELKREGLDFYKRSNPPLVRVEVKIRLDNGNAFNGGLVRKGDAIEYLQHVVESMEKGIDRTIRICTGLFIEFQT